MHIARKRNPSCIAQPSKTKVLRFMLIPAATLGDLQHEKPHIIGSNGHFCAISEHTPRMVQHISSARVASSHVISLQSSAMVSPACCSPSWGSLDMVVSVMKISGMDYTSIVGNLARSSPLRHPQIARCNGLVELSDMAFSIVGPSGTDSRSQPPV